MPPVLLIRGRAESDHVEGIPEGVPPHERLLHEDGRTTGRTGRAGGRSCPLAWLDSAGPGRSRGRCLPPASAPLLISGKSGEYSPVLPRLPRDQRQGEKGARARGGVADRGAAAAPLRRTRPTVPPLQRTRPGGRGPLTLRRHGPDPRGPDLGRAARLRDDASHPGRGAERAAGRAPARLSGGAERGTPESSGTAGVRVRSCVRWTRPQAFERCSGSSGTRFVRAPARLWSAGSVVRTRLPTPLGAHLLSDSSAPPAPPACRSGALRAPITPVR